MQQKACTKCDKSVGSPEEDGALGGNKVKKTIKTLWNQ